MRTITYNGVEYACPFTHHFRRHTPDEHAAMRESIESGGILNPIRLYTDTDNETENCILDGEGRLEAAAALGAALTWKVPFEFVGEMSTAEAYELAKVLNDHRRQDDPAEVRKRRIERLVERRSEGASLRTLSEEEKVSVAQVRRDLAEAGVPPPVHLKPDGEEKPEPTTPQPATDDTFSLADQPEEPEPPATVKPTGGKVKGKDGKNYTATPKKPAAKKPPIEPAKALTSPLTPAADPADKPRDQLGRVLPKHLVPVFDKRAECRAASADLGRAFSKLKAIDADETVGGFLKRRPQIKTDIAGVAGVIRTRLAPYAVCPACEGDGAKGECPSCGGKGWLTRHEFGALHELLRDKARSFRPGDSWEGDDPVPDGCECEDAPDPQRHCVSPAADAAGNPVPKHLRDLFHGDFLFDTLRDLASIARQLDDAKSWLHWLEPETHRHAKLLIECVEKAVPHEVCVVCEGKGCGQCMMSGYHPEWSCASGRNKPVEKPAKKGKKKGAA